MAALFQDAHSWIAVSFVLFCGVAWVFGRKPMAAKLDGRIAAVRKDIESAEKLKGEAQALLDDYRLKQQEAAAEASRIVENARRHATEIQRNAERGLAETAALHEQQLNDRLKRMEENAMNEIRAFAADLAVKATAELIATHMDAQTNSKLIDESIKTLAKDAA